MQATAAPASTSPAQLARDLHAFVGCLHRGSSEDLLRALGESELSLTQVKALHVLDDHDGAAVHLGDLAERLVISLPAASRAVELLHRRGWVERRENERDRRIKEVRATPAGRQLVRRLNRARLAGLERLAASLTEEERAALAAALRPVLARQEVSPRRRTRPAAR